MKHSILTLLTAALLTSCSHVADGVVMTALAIKGKKPAEWRLEMTDAYTFDEEVTRR